MNEEILNKYAENSANFHIKILEWLNQQDISDVPTFGIIHSFFSVAVQGTVFKGNYEEFRQNMINTLDKVITQSIEHGLIQKVDEHV